MEKYIACAVEKKLNGTQKDVNYVPFLNADYETFESINSLYKNNGYFIVCTAGFIPALIAEFDKLCLPYTSTILRGEYIEFCGKEVIELT